MAIKPIPDGFHTITPHMVIRNASAAIDFYKNAFRAEVVDLMPGPGGEGVMHATLRIGDSFLMIADEFPHMEKWASPDTFKGTTVGIHLFVENVDAVFERAVNAGATVLMAPVDMFWGDRYAQVIDPFGHAWSMATKIKEMTQEEIQAASEEAMKNLNSGHCD